MKIEKLAWLAGAWDGEGTIGLTKYEGKWFDKKRNQERREFKLKPYICLINTNVSFIAEAVKVLDEEGIRLPVFEVKKEKDYFKQGYRIQTFNMTKIKEVLDLISPYLISKKPNAELLLRFVNMRLEKMKDNPSGKSTPHYTDEEIEKAEGILISLQELNKRSSKNESSQTIR
jgi:hypothetical protein